MSVCKCIQETKRAPSVLKYCSLYSNISFGKRVLFITKKGTFGSLQKFGGTCPLGSYAPGPGDDNSLHVRIFETMNFTCDQFGEIYKTMRLFAQYF